MKLYAVQTFYGTKSKVFQKEYNARRYYNQLAKDNDPDLLELYSFNVSCDDFIYTDIDD